MWRRRPAVLPAAQGFAKRDRRAIAGHAHARQPWAVRGSVQPDECTGRRALGIQRHPPHVHHPIARLQNRCREPPARQHAICLADEAPIDVERVDEHGKSVRPDDRSVRDETGSLLPRGLARPRPPALDHGLRETALRPDPAAAKDTAVGRWSGDGSDLAPRAVPPRRLRGQPAPQRRRCERSDPRQREASSPNAGELYDQCPHTPGGPSKAALASGARPGDPAHPEASGAPQSGDRTSRSRGGSGSTAREVARR